MTVSTSEVINMQSKAYVNLSAQELIDAALSRGEGELAATKP